MSKFIELWTPDVVIAAIVIIACLALRFCGINGEVWALLLLAAGWVFGGTYQRRKTVTELAKVHTTENDKRK